MLTIYRDRKLLYLLTITSFGIAIGALWEITEWTAGIVLSSKVIGSLDDTIIDLIMDSFGSAIAALTSLCCKNGLAPVRQVGRVHLPSIVRSTIALNSKQHDQFVLDRLSSDRYFLRA
jgi:long-subunit fatty acid transport protein